MWTGIDIGHSYIKVVQIEPSFRGFRLVGIARLRNELPPEKEGSTSSTLRSFARSQVTRLFTQGGLVPSRCVIGISGKNINLRVIQMPPIKSPIRFKKMMEYELLQMGGKSGEKLYSDYCHLILPDKSYPEIPILVGMAKSDFVDEEIARLRRTYLSVQEVCPNAIALSYALRENEAVKPDEVFLLVDIGAVNTEMVIHRGEHLIFARNIAGGGRNLTETIQNRLEVSAQEAEQLKISSCSMLPRETEISGEDKTIQEALRSGVGQIQSAIESAISFAQAQLKIDGLSANKIFISGGTANLKGLAGYLGETLNRPVEVFNPFKNITRAVSSNTRLKEERQGITESDCDFTIALGLSLSGAAYDRSRHVSFLPLHLKKKRAFYQSTIPLVIAGIIIFIGMLLWAINTYSAYDNQTYAIDKLKKEAENFNAVTKKLETLKGRRQVIESNYDKLNNIPRTTDLLDVVIKLISQYMPSEAWVKEIHLANIPVKSDPKSKGIEGEPTKEIILTGYLEDYNPYNLENMETFVDNLNQPNPDVYGGIVLEASLKRLETPKIVIPRGKREFEIIIKTRK
ncbi:MAG: pilus assembly protein PilM [Planctomycetota bacterium]|nr:pilus assembly protein PilM [Planctomycetota bacterium]MDI6787721.1 pilus assembly protein PilM [Planctomycetota bacterium]